MDLILKNSIYHAGTVFFLCVALGLVAFALDRFVGFMRAVSLCLSNQISAKKFD